MRTRGKSLKFKENSSSDLLDSNRWNRVESSTDGFVGNETIHFYRFLICARKHGEAVKCERTRIPAIANLRQFNRTFRHGRLVRLFTVAARHLSAPHPTGLVCMQCHATEASVRDEQLHRGKLRHGKTHHGEPLGDRSKRTHSRRVRFSSGGCQRENAQFERQPGLEIGFDSKLSCSLRSPLSRSEIQTFW